MAASKASKPHTANVRSTRFAIVVFSRLERWLNLGSYHDDAADILFGGGHADDAQSLSRIVDNSVDKLLITCV